MLWGEWFNWKGTLHFRWIYTERSYTSGLAVLEVDIPTGYVVMNDTLRDYVRSGITPNLKRAEFYSRKVVFYFNYVSRVVLGIMGQNAGV